MRSETDTHAGLLKADLLRELKARGIRGAYARRLAAEWVDHYRNLAEVMPALEAFARLGKTGELAQAAAEERFGGRWWWRFPASAGILWGILAWFVSMGWVSMPVLAALHGLMPVSGLKWFAPAFNWVGPLIIFTVAWWLSDNLSSPRAFRRSLLITLGGLLTFTIMSFQMPAASGASPGSVTMGLTANPGIDHDTQIWIPGLIVIRMALLAGFIFWFRRSDTSRA
jgi:hypothetical protein